MVDRRGAGFEHVPLVRARQRNGDVLQVESTGDRSRQHRDRLAAVGDHQHIATQVEQARELVPSPHRFLRSRAGHRRQVAGHQADGQKREQRDPVLRIGNREGADWRQEEEVEAEHRHDRRDHGDPQTRRRRRRRARSSGTSSKRSPRSTREAIVHVDECDRRDGADAPAPSRTTSDERLVMTETPMNGQISTCTPSSTTRSGGSLKNVVARTAFRAISTNSRSRHIAIPGVFVTINVSRPRK